MKSFKLIEEQIEIIKSRNLLIDDEPLSKKFLMLNNYYNVINCYGKFLIDNNSPKEQYVLGSNFSNIVGIHQFDSRFKNTIFNFLLDIERNFISVLAYHYSKRFNKNQQSYLNILTYKNKAPIKSVKEMVDIFETIINKHKGSASNNSIKHYLNNHGSIPFWVICEYLTFGQALTFYSLITDDVRNDVAKQFSIFASSNLSQNIKITSLNLYTILSNLKDVRNIIAHNSIIFHYKCKGNYPYFPYIHDKNNINRASNKQDIFNTIIIFKLFMTENQYTILYNSILSKFKKLNKNIDISSLKSIYASLGFPEDFHTYSKLPQ